MGIKSKKQLRRERARLKNLKSQGISHEPAVNESVHSTHKKREEGVLGKVKDIYENKYKVLLLLPLLLFILAVGQLGYQYATTGEYMNKGVALKGGITLTIPATDADILAVEQALITQFPSYDVSARALTTPGRADGMLLEAGLTDQEIIKEFTGAVEQQLSITSDEYTIEVIGSSLGASFFTQTMRALFAAFLFMGIVVFFYFGENIGAKAASLAFAILSAIAMFAGQSIVTDVLAGILGIITIGIFIKYSIPSVAVMAAAAADIIITLAIVNLLGIKMSPAGIAAFLMLIGYSVDTDILLSTRVLKRKEGTVMDGVYSAIKTGMTMTGTTIAAVIAGLVLSTAPVLKEIMTIILIGLFIDIISTWIQNVGLLRWYLDAKGGKEE